MINIFQEYVTSFYRSKAWLWPQKATSHEMSVLLFVVVTTYHHSGVLPIHLWLLNQPWKIFVAEYSSDNSRDRKK